MFDTHGGMNVYFSSQRFTEWASPENIASTIGTGIATGGSNAGQAIQEARDVILGELGNIYSWLKQHAPEEVEALMASAFKSIVSGENYESPLLSVEFVNIEKEYTIGLGGPAASIANSLGNSSPSKTFTTTQMGFAVVLKSSGGVTATLDQLEQVINGQPSAAEEEYFALISRIANRPELEGLGPLANAVLQSNPGMSVDKTVSSMLRKAFEFNSADLRKGFIEGNPIVSLKDTHISQKLQSVLKIIAAGNEGKVIIEDLQLNLNTFEITATISVNHRHSWGSIEEILNTVGNKVGEWGDKAGNAVKQQVDSVGNIVREVIYVTGNRITETYAQTGELLHRNVLSPTGKLVESMYQGGTEVLRKTFVNGRETLRQTWQSGGRYVENHFSNGREVLRKTFVNNKQVLEQTWSSSGAYAENAWDSAGKLIKGGKSQLEKTLGIRL